MLYIFFYYTKYIVIMTRLDLCQVLGIKVKTRVQKFVYLNRG